MISHFTTKTSEVSANELAKTSEVWAAIYEAGKRPASCRAYFLTSGKNTGQVSIDRHRKPEQSELSEAEYSPAAGWPMAPSNV